MYAPLHVDDTIHKSQNTTNQFDTLNKMLSFMLPTALTRRSSPDVYLLTFHRNYDTHIVLALSIPSNLFVFLIASTGNCQNRTESGQMKEKAGVDTGDFMCISLLLPTQNCNVTGSV